MLEPNQEVQAGAREYINSVKDEPWYQVDYDDIILDAFIGGMVWFRDKINAEVDAYPVY